MQFAIKNQFPLVVDNATRYATRLLISFRSLDPILAKGKSKQTRLFVPVNEFNLVNERHPPKSESYRFVIACVYLYNTLSS